MLDLNKPLQTRDGLCKVRFLGERESRDGKILVFAKQENRIPHHEMIVTRYENGQSMRELASGADIVNVVDRQVRFVNLQKDKTSKGGLIRTETRKRDSLEGSDMKALFHTLRLTIEDDVLVSAEVIR